MRKILDGTFCDRKGIDGVDRFYEVHRRSIHPVMRVCQKCETSLNGKALEECNSQERMCWLAEYLADT